MTRPSMWRDEADDFNDILARLKRLELGSTQWSPGDIKAGAYTAPDDGWLACDYTFKSQTLYPLLFAKIGHTYNGGTDPGDGTFRLPDGKGRSLVGAGDGDATGHTAHTLGAKVGEQTHLLTSAESGLPAHSHPAKMSSVASVDFSGFGTGGPANAGNSTGNIVNNTAANAASAHENRSPATVVNFFIKY